MEKEEKNYELPSAENQLSGSDKKKSTVATIFQNMINKMIDVVTKGTIKVKDFLDNGKNDSKGMGC